MAQMEKSSFVGIDLGTYNSAAAVIVKGGVKAVRAEEGRSALPFRARGEEVKEFPSFISFHPDGAVKDVGLAGKNEAAKSPETVVWGVKRLLGRSFSDLAESGELARFPFSVKADRKNGQCIVRVGGQSYTPVELCALILGRIKTRAESELKGPVSGAVVSVPAYYDPLRVSPIVEAARLAGFSHVRTIPEPVAAALAYEREITVRPLRVVVFDLGAGTLDVTAGLMYQVPGKPGEYGFMVEKNTGNPALGGMDMDDRLAELLAGRAGLAGLSPGDRASLRRAAENAKIRLSEETRVEAVAHLSKGSIKVELDRYDLAAALSAPPLDILEECRAQVMAAVTGAGWLPQDVDLLFPVGGPTRLSVVEDVLRVAFQSNPAVLDQIERFAAGAGPVDPMNAVAAGAALSLTRRVSDKVPTGYGFEDYDIEPGKMVLKPRILIPPDSPCPFTSPPYPISWSVTSGHYEFKILQKIPKSQAREPGQDYHFVGIQRFAVKFPELSRVMLQMGYNENRELVVTIQDPVTRHSVRYTGIASSLSVPMRYPLTLARPEGAAAKRLRRVFPADDDLARFAKWAGDVLRNVSIKLAGFHLPQPELLQTARELQALLSEPREWEQAYNAINGLLYGAHARGVLSPEEYNQANQKICEFERVLFKLEEER